MVDCDNVNIWLKLLSCNEVLVCYCEVHLTTRKTIRRETRVNTYYALGVFLLPFDQMWLRQTRRVYTARVRSRLHI